MMRRFLLTLALGGTLAVAQNAPRVPAIDDRLSLKTAGGPEISPDGRWVAYGVSEADYDKDAFVTQVWLADTTSGSNIQITRGEKGASNYQWSPDGTWLTFTSTRAGDKSQIFALRPDGGEAMQWTKSETGVNSYAWSRDGKTIAFTATEPVPQPEKDRKEYLDEYKVVRREYSHVHLWTFDVAGTLVLLDGVVRSFCFIWMRQIHSSKLWYRETTNRYWAPPIDTCFFFKASIFS